MVSLGEAVVGVFQGEVASGVGGIDAGKSSGVVCAGVGGGAVFVASLVT